jgi:hypothetical protein
VRSFCRAAATAGALFLIVLADRPTTGVAMGAAQVPAASPAWLVSSPPGGVAAVPARALPPALIRLTKPPHEIAMMMTEKGGKSEARQAAQAQAEARAKALRANLKRRKEAARAGDSPAAPQRETDTHGQDQNRRRP